MSRPDVPARWPVALATAVVWAAAAASAVFWGLRLLAPREAAPPPVVAAAPAAPDAAAVARALGAQPVLADAAPMPDAAGRFQLLGVVSDELGRGVALIAVDGRPARPYRAGALLSQQHVLQSVQGRQARIGADHDGPALFTLSLPAPVLAANGPPRPLPPMAP